MNRSVHREPAPYLICEPLIYVPIVLAALLAWFAPLDIMDRMPQVKQLTGLLRSAFPAMDAYVRKSSFPQVTEIYFAVMALHAPFHVPFIYKDYRQRLAMFRANWHKAVVGRLATVLCAFFMFPAFAVFAVLVNPGYDLAWMPINSERWALGLCGWFLAGAGAVLMATTSALWIWGLLTGDIRRGATEI